MGRYIRCGLMIISAVLMVAGTHAARITGYVTDYYGTVSVPGVSVSFLEYYGADTTIYEAVTGENGHYEVTLPAGTYLAAADPSDSGLRYQAQYYGGVLSPYWSYPVTVDEDAPLDGVNFYLWTGYRLSGRVEGAGGVSDLLLYDHTTGFYFWGMTGVSTDESGSFTVYVPQGVYSVFAYASGIGIDAERSPLVVNDDISDIHLIYPATGYVSGKVTTASGESAVSVRVDALDAATGYAMGYAVTDENGDYRIDGLAAGRGVYLLVRTRFHPEGAYADIPGIFWPGRVSPEDAETVMVTVSGSDGMDMVLPASGGAVSGRVTNTSGEPVEGATVYDFYYPEVLNRYVPISQRVAVTDEDGRYRLTGIGAARIGVAAVAAGYVSQFWNGVEQTTVLTSATPIDMPVNGDVTGVDFTLRTIPEENEPVLTSISPHLIYGVGEKTLVITGSGFQAGADVDLIDMYPFRYEGTYPEIRRVHVQSERVEVAVALNGTTAKGPFYLAVTNPGGGYIMAGFSVIAPDIDPQVSVLAAPPVFNSECTLSLGMNMENLTPAPRTVDAYLGLVLPTGDAIFFDGETFTTEFMSMFENLTLESGFFLPQFLFFEIPLDGAEVPAGDYLWFAALTDAGTYDIVSFSSKVIHY